MATAAFISVASMMGIAPTIGYVAKESTLTARLEDAQHGSTWGWIALVGVTVGAVLTVAYGCRFLWGAFGRKKDLHGVELPRTPWPDPPVGFLASPIILAGLSIAAGIGAPAVDVMLQGYARTFDPVLGETGHLALWHGLEPALLISLGAIAFGIGAFVGSIRSGWHRWPRMLRFTAADAYYLTMRGVDRLSVLTTSVTQRGSLPLYVGTIFVVLLAAEATSLVGAAPQQLELSAWHTPAQLVVAPVMAIEIGRAHV